MEREIKGSVFFFSVALKTSLHICSEKLIINSNVHKKQLGTQRARKQVLVVDSDAQPDFIIFFSLPE